MLTFPVPACYRMLIGKRNLKKGDPFISEKYGSLEDLIGELEDEGHDFKTNHR